MRSLIISLPKTSPLLFPISSHTHIHKQQPIRHIYSYIRSLFIGIDIPLPPLKQAIVTTNKQQHKLHLSYTHTDRDILQRTQQLCTKVGLLCHTLSFIPPISTSPSPSISTSNKHVIDLELLPDEWDDEFLQPQPIGTPTITVNKQKQTHKKHVKFNTSRNTIHYIPNNQHQHNITQSKQTLTPTPTSTIKFSEWEKLSLEARCQLQYTFCIQCEKPMYEKYLYDHMQLHVKQHQHHQQHTSQQTISTTSTTSPMPTSTPISTRLSTSTSTLTYTCPYDQCQHKFNPNSKHFVRDLNAHIDCYHDNTDT